MAGTAWSTLATFGKQLLTFASVATVARMLGPGAYGLMGLAGLIILFIGNFRDLGTGAALIQKPSVTPSLLSSLFWINLLVGALFSVIVWASAPAASRFFHAPELTAILRVLCASLLLASAGVVHGALLNREMRYRALAAIDFLSALASYGVALGCALSGLGVWSLVFASIAGSLTATCGYVLANSFRPRLEFAPSEVRSIGRFSGNLSAFGIVNFAYRNADNLIVGRVLGSVSLGFYQMAYNLMLTPIQNISSVIAQVLFPAFSRIQGEDERFRQAYVRACMLTALVTFPVMAGLAVVADPLIRAVLGPKWAATIPIFQILAPVGLVQSIQTTTGMIFQAKGRTDLMLRCGILVLIVVVIAFMIGAHFGATGVAAGYAIAYLALLTYPLFAIPFRLIGLPVRDFVGALIPQLLITAVMATACYAWLAFLAHFPQLGPWVRLFTGSAVGVITYVLLVLSVRPRVLTYAEEALESSDHSAARLGVRLLRASRRLLAVR